MEKNKMFRKRLAIALLLIPIFGCAKERRMEVNSFVISRGDTVYLVREGIAIDASDRRQLSFIAISRSSDGEASAFALATYTAEGAEVQIAGPDGTTSPLQSSAMLYQEIDGIWQQSDERITLDEWESFKDSEPSEFSIDAVLAFVDRGGDTND